MGLRTIHFIGLIAGALVMWDRSLLVETASDQNTRTPNGALRPRIPPGIVLPLPYVYPEYVDPREQNTMVISKAQDNPDTTETTSVSEIILDNVRKTISASSSLEEFQPNVHQQRDKSNERVEEKNEHDSSVSSNNENEMIENNKKIIENNEEMIDNNKEMINSKPVEEMKRPFGKRPIKFGTRLRPTYSAKQHFFNVTTTTTIAPFTNDDTDNGSKEDSNDGKAIYDESTPRIASRKVPVNETANDNDVIIRKRPISMVRRLPIRRLRPSAENSKTVARTVRRRRPVKIQDTTTDSQIEIENPIKKIESDDDAETKN